MPTYVYHCRDCQQDIEVVQRFSDDPWTVCPRCGGSLHRVLFPPAIIFKGSGWYCTDHGRSSSGNGKSGNGGGKEAEQLSPDKATAKEPAVSKGAAGGDDD